MVEPQPLPLPREDAPVPAPVGRARRVLMRRLADVVCLPSSRVNAFERAMTADLLVEILHDAEPADRLRVAQRLSGLRDIPSPLARLLLADAFEVAAPLLAEGTGLSDPDLIFCIARTTPDHRRLIASRRDVSESVAEALAASTDLPVIEVLLKNVEARLSGAALETILGLSRQTPALVAGLLRRGELRPAQAYNLFWWAGPNERGTILQRFAVSREILQDSSADIFRLCTEEGWQDPLVRKALQFIERRQRNRAAIAKSPFESLDEAVAAAAGGMTREIAEEVSYLAGVKPMTGARIFTDPLGEPIAILCKATGLPRAAVLALWRGLKRPEADSSGAMTPALERTLITYDIMAVDRAQTVLRYWNWSMATGAPPTA